MKRALLFGLLLVAVTIRTLGQTPLTTVILVRHAEKANDGTKDPPLSDEGKARAIRLSNLLAASNVSAVYSSPFQRTRQTADPTAARKSLTVLEYDPSSKTALGDIVKKHQGQTVLIVGHSNTVPGMVAELEGKAAFTNFDDSDYGNLIIVTFAQAGANASVTWLRF